MSRHISPGCLETSVRDVLSQHTAPATHVMSQDIADARTHELWVRASLISGWGRVVGRWAGSRGWGRGPVRAEFAGGGVDDPDVQVLDQEQDVGSGVGSA